MGPMVDRASLSDSIDLLAPVPDPCAREGEEGEEDMARCDRLVRRLIVTLLEVGSGAGWEDMFGGV